MASATTVINAIAEDKGGKVLHFQKQQMQNMKSQYFDVQKGISQQQQQQNWLALISNLPKASVEKSANNDTFERRYVDRISCYLTSIINFQYT